MVDVKMSCVGETLEAPVLEFFPVRLELLCFHTGCDFTDFYTLTLFVIFVMLQETERHLH